MHEMALVRNVVDIVVEQAAAANVKKVKAVYLTIGNGRDIVEDYFDGLFEFLARGTAAEGAELTIFRTPMTVKCNRCGFVFPINVFKPETWVCPACKAEKDYTLNSGMEFAIDRIEVYRDDAPEVKAMEAEKAAKAAGEDQAEGADKPQAE